MAVAELMFGRNIGGRLGVSELQWRKFLDREITPRFPNGLSVLDAKGQWHDTERHIIVREPSKIVIVVLTGKADDDDQLKAVIEAYKASFKQQSVGLIVRPACVAL